MPDRALVIGGTGPTGIPLVRGLVDRGHEVTILHRGTHERAETPAEVEHLHADPYDEDVAPRGARRARRFDVIARDVRPAAPASPRSSAGRTGHFVSVGGVPAYRGWMNPWLYDPPGLPVPVAEDAPTGRRARASDEKGYRIVRTEERGVRAPPARPTHFRYPYVYGPHQLVPREWSIVRRVLDGRGRIVVADDGLTLHHHGYTENLAAAVLLAVEQPDARGRHDLQRRRRGGADGPAGGRAVRRARSATDLEIVSMPYDLAVPARPLLAQPLPTHRVLDLTRLRHELGYRDVGAGARGRCAGTARWLAEQPARARRACEETCSPTRSTTPPRTRSIDVVARGARVGGACRAFAREPRYGLAYSGPGGRPRSKPEFDRMTRRTGPLAGIKVLDLLDRAHRPVRGRAARRPGCRRRQGRAAGHRRHRPLGRRRRERHERAVHRSATAASARSRSTSHADEGRTSCAGSPRDADVVVQNFRPGVLDRLGLGYDDARGRQPRARLRVALGLRRRGPVRATRAPTTR